MRRHRNFKPSSTYSNQKRFRPTPSCPFLKGADYYAMIATFGDCLAPGGKDDLRQTCLQWFKREKGLETEEEVCAL